MNFRDKLDANAQQKVEENWPKVQQVFQEKIGPAAICVGGTQRSAAVPDLISISRNEDEDYKVRRVAAVALYDIGTREARIAYKEWERQDKES